MISDNNNPFAAFPAPRAAPAAFAFGAPAPAAPAPAAFTFGAPAPAAFAFGTPAPAAPAPAAFAFGTPAPAAPAPTPAFAFGAPAPAAFRFGAPAAPVPGAAPATTGTVAVAAVPAIPAAGGDATTEDSTVGFSEQAGDDHVGMFSVWCGSILFLSVQSQTEKLLRMFTKSPTTPFWRLHYHIPFISDYMRSLVVVYSKCRYPW